jgi:hypothetical protein
MSKKAHFLGMFFECVMKMMYLCNELFEGSENKMDILGSQTIVERMKRIALLSVLILTAPVVASAQQDDPGQLVVTPTVKVGKVLVDGDSIQYMEMSNVYVYPEPTFKSKRQQQAYMRLVRNVKKVLPIAKEVRQILIETAEYVETLPTQKERDEHLKRVEASIVREYKPKMKKLTFSQGKLLIKLVDRECHSTAYEAIQAFIGPVRSGMWQAFAWMFGASLKKGYEPEGVDRLTERVVLMVEAGQI